MTFNTSTTVTAASHPPPDVSVSVSCPQWDAGHEAPSHRSHSVETSTFPNPLN